MNGCDDYSEKITDVIEAIQNTDPIFRRQATTCSRSLTMLSGGSIENSATYPAANHRRSPYVEIIEQPASKALRFRYECEGRSAGSIPGVNSTPENKTFPSIRIVGYKGRAMVVVSCVTKDPPYKPHPHNIVGKEACKDGFCSVPVGPDSMAVSFAGLGIQCVKKKDIEEALRLREKNKIDPFRTGFEHRKQPAGIDLNSVRLCFEVYLKSSQSGDYRVRLAPVVSDPIFDKKAMSDLVICKLSHYSASVAGGMDMMLLCEKVAKEDIQVRFFEERDGEIWWEGQGDFQPSQVHKQVAIAFRTPSYRDQYAEQPVQVYIQLRRPSDNVTSEPLPFQLLPIGTGRPAFWSLRRSFIKKKADPATFKQILATDTSVVQKIPRNIDEFNNNLPNGKISALRALRDLYRTPNDSLPKPSIPRPANDLENTDPTPPNAGNTQKLRENARADWFDYSEVGKWVQKAQECDVKLTELKSEDESIDELLTQVAELDEIYADTHARMLQADLDGQLMEVDVSDNQTYTSLQMAMKNPVDPVERRYEDVAPPEPTVHILPPPLAPKRDVSHAYEEKLPPLPPKRIRKMTSMPVLPRATSCTTVNEAPHKILPSPPATLGRQKNSLFAKLFPKKKKKDLDGPLRGSFSSLRAHDIPDPRPEVNSVDIKALELPDESLGYGADLTEAEHYALYTAMAPHATASEFDELSFYYSPVEGGKILTDAANG